MRIKEKQKSGPKETSLLYIRQRQRLCFVLAVKQHFAQIVAAKTTGLRYFRPLKLQMAKSPGFSVIKRL